MPRLSIGLPVYNGERFIRDSIESILSQTFSDFELIISDNGSTDGTESICRMYSTMDKRVRYMRFNHNHGAARNFNVVFSSSTGEFFKWASCDDICGQDYFSECVTALERDSSVVLAFPRTIIISETGDVIGPENSILNASSPVPSERFKQLILSKHACFQVFGVARRSALEKTFLIGGYSGSDRVLLAELSLHGRFMEIDKPLFMRRSHPGASCRLYPDPRERTAWFDTSRAGKLNMPVWRMLKEYTLAILRSPICKTEKLLCLKIFTVWLRKNLRPLVGDLMDAGKKGLFSGI